MRPSRRRPDRGRRTRGLLRQDGAHEPTVALARLRLIEKYRRTAS